MNCKKFISFFYEIKYKFYAKNDNCKILEIVDLKSKIFFKILIKILEIIYIYIYNGCVKNPTDV